MTGGARDAYLVSWHLPRRPKRIPGSLVSNLKKNGPGCGVPGPRGPKECLFRQARCVLDCCSLP